MKVRRFMSVCLLMGALASVSCTPARAPRAEVPVGYERIRLVGGSLGGRLTTSAMAYATMLNKYYPDIEWSSATGTTATNPIYLTKGEVKLALVNASNYVLAYGLDKVPESRLRSLNVAQPLTWYLFIIPEDKPWKDITEVPKGLTLNAGTGSAPDVCEAWLKVSGLSKNDFKVLSTGKAEMADGWRAGKLDFLFFSLGGPDPVLTDLMISPRKIKAMGLSPQQAAKAKAERTFEALGMEPPSMANLTEIAGEYFKYDVLATGQPLFLASRDDFPDEIAYKMAKTIDEQIAQLAGIYASMKYATPQLHMEWAKPPVQIHPGVAKYYREKGYLK